MRTDRNPVMVDPETHARLKKLADEAGIPIGGLIKNMVNIIETRVLHAKEAGIVPKEHPKVINPLLKNYGQPTETYSDWCVFLALHLRETGKISEESFQVNKENLPFFMFILGGPGPRIFEK
jgi:hypothetical protein